MLKYNDNMLEIEDIVDSLYKNRLSVFCGAGATVNATGATWVTLFQTAMQTIDKDVHDFYKLAEYYQVIYGRGKLINTVCNIFSKMGPSKHIAHLLKLPIYKFWTTNFDCIIERMICTKTHIVPSVIYDSKNIIKINEKKKYQVFKMNGCVTDNNSMVLTSTDFENYKYNQAPLIEFLKRELILNTFLFIGYSFEDKLVLNCLSQNRQYFPSMNYYHYRIIKREEKHRKFQKVEQKYFEDSYKIKTIFVDSYDEIDNFIDSIYEKYISKNIFISGSFRSLSAEEENKANTLCKILVESLLEQGYNIYSGDGKRLGSYVITNAAKKLLSNNQLTQNRLHIRPLIDHSFKTKDAGDKDRRELINKMMEDCSAAIFLYGQSEQNGISKGVRVEYQEARKREMLTIPVPTTGFAAKAIYDEMKSSGVPGYLEKYSSILEVEKDPQKLVKTIIEILNVNSK